MKVINKTEHPIKIVDRDGNVVKTYPKSDIPIRLTKKVVRIQPLPDGTPLTITKFGKPKGLPNYGTGKIYIVSQFVKNALPNRPDLLVPTEVVKNSEGVILGYKSLGK